MKTSVLVATMALAVFGAPGSDALLAGLRRNNEGEFVRRTQTRERNEDGSKQGC